MQRNQSFTPGLFPIFSLPPFMEYSYTHIFLFLRFFAGIFLWIRRVKQKKEKSPDFVDNNFL